MFYVCYKVVMFTIILTGKGPKHIMMWQQMTGKAPWTSESEGSEGEETQGCQERRESMREMRKARRQMCRQMGWMPFRRAAWGDSADDAGKSDDEGTEGRNQRCTEFREKSQKFRALVQDTGVKPWMFKVLAEVLHCEPQPEKKKDESKMSAEKKEKRELKQRFHKALNEIGAEPWMFRVLGNMRARGKSCSDSGEEGRSPCRRQMRRNRRQMFCRIAKQMGWDGMSDSEGQSEGQEKSGDEKEVESQMAAPAPWMMSAMMGPTGHHHGPWAHFRHHGHHHGRHGRHGHHHGPHGHHKGRHGRHHGANHHHQAH